MPTINEYFDKVICINNEHRTDRWKDCLQQFINFKIECERFNAHWMPNDGNRGCTASHRGVFELICHHRWKRTLILEDDFQIIHDDFQVRFSDMIGQVPTDWEMLYLGGHYAEKPLARVTANVIRCGYMMTTSSYAVTYDYARKFAPWIFGVGPIDTLFYATHRPGGRSYIFQPRLMVQRKSFSDLQNRVCDNTPPMMDTNHENMV